MLPSRAAGRALAISACLVPHAFIGRPEQIALYADRLEKSKVAERWCILDKTVLGAATETRSPCAARLPDERIVCTVRFDGEHANASRLGFSSGCRRAGLRAIVQVRPPGG